MGAHISPSASIIYEAQKRTKNSITYVCPFNRVESKRLTRQIKLVPFLAYFGVDLYCRTQSNWSKCDKYYFRGTQYGGIYHGYLGKTFTILHLPEDDSTLYVYEYKEGYKPSQKAVSEIIARLNS